MQIVSFTNVDTSGTNGSGAIGAIASGNAAFGAPTATLVTTRANSWVYGVGSDFDQAVARTIGPNQTMVHQFLSPSGDTYWMQRTTNAVTAAGTSVTINDTAPTGDRYNLFIAEIRTSDTPDTIAPTASVTAPAGGATVGGTVSVTATASDNVGVVGRAVQARRRQPRRRGHVVAVLRELEHDDRVERHAHADGRRARRRGQHDDVGGCHGDGHQRHDAPP